jgi:integrin beta 8
VPSDAIGIAGDYFFRTDTGEVYVKGAFTWGAAIADMTGPAGADGADGTNGSSVLNGSGAPSSGLGAIGDFYIDTTAHSIYGPKSGGGWGSATSLVGPAGAAGADGTNGVQRKPAADVTLEDGRSITANEYFKVGGAINLRLNGDSVLRIS